MRRDNKVFVVIFAGGVGSRMKGAQRPKQFLVLGGKPIIAHTIQHFQNHPRVSSIAVACVESWIPEMSKVVSEFRFDKVTAIVSGGETGQDSIFNGLRALGALEYPPASDDVVLIHDGVRPLIDSATIDCCVESVEKRGPTAVTAPATETVVVGDGAEVERILERSRCRLARAPQGFCYGELLGVHERARAEGFHDAVDSVSLMARYGCRVFAVDGPEENIKITTPRDFFAFKSFVDMGEVAQIWEP